MPRRSGSWERRARSIQLETSTLRHTAQCISEVEPMYVYSLKNKESWSLSVKPSAVTWPSAARLAACGCEEKANPQPRQQTLILNIKIQKY